MALRRPARLGVAVLAGALGLLVLAAAVHRLGTTPLLGLAALGVVAVLITRPGLTVALLVALVALGESDPTGTIAPTPFLYDYSLTAFVTPAEALGLLALAAVALRGWAERDLRLPGPATASLTLLLAAVVVGYVVAVSGGSSSTDAFEGVRTILAIPVGALLAVNVVRTEQHLRRALALLAALAATKALMGLAGTVLNVDPGNSGAIGGGGETLTSLSAAVNLPLVAASLFLLGSLLGRVRLPLWAYGVLPLALASLVLSYRRAFYLAFAVGLVVVVVVAAGRVGRRLLVPAVVVIAALGVLGLRAGLSDGLDGPVVQRVQSLDPTKIRTNDQDRYRLDERRNVLAEIRREPLAGLGISAVWRQRYPLPFANAEARSYVHFALLWWWLKMGLLGALAYVVLIGTGVATGLAGARARSHLDLGALACLAVAASFLGYAVAELTATFTGTDVRTDVLLGGALGLVAAIRRLGADGSAPGGDALGELEPSAAGDLERVVRADVLAR